MDSNDVCKGQDGGAPQSPYLSIEKEMEMHCAHYLKEHDGKCNEMHGHTYKVKVTLWGNIDLKTNMLVDVGVLKDLIIKPHDHKCLNLTMNTENPTMEFMAWRFAHVLNDCLPKNIDEIIVEVWETKTASAYYCLDREVE